MYELCGAQNAEQIKKQIKVKNLEQAIAELYQAFELTFILLNGNYWSTSYVFTC